MVPEQIGYILISEFYLGRIGGAYLACLKGVQFVWHLRLVQLNLNVASVTLNKNLSCCAIFGSFTPQILKTTIIFRACNSRNNDYINTSECHCGLT